MRIAIDFGISNTDAVLEDSMGMIAGHWTVPSASRPDEAVLRSLIAQQATAIADLEEIIVTGGRSRNVPRMIEKRPVRFVDEIVAIGRGGAALSGRDEVLVMSAGSGTALVAVRGSEVTHVGGTALGGGTLIGLARLLLNTTSPDALDRLALSGNINAVDLSIGEVIGGDVGIIPADATAVNFGRVAREGQRPAAPDIAAGLTTMIGQQIGLLAAITARGLGMRQIVAAGHLVEMGTIANQLHAVGAIYECEFIIPPEPGIVAAMGALVAANE